MQCRPATARMNDCLSIISVVYRDSRFWERNVGLTRKLDLQDE
jgi:hypothetical protein